MVQGRNVRHCPDGRQGLWCAYSNLMQMSHAVPCHCNQQDSTPGIVVNIILRLTYSLSEMSSLHVAGFVTYSDPQCAQAFLEVRPDKSQGHCWPAASFDKTGAAHSQGVLEAACHTTNWSPLLYIAEEGA